MSDDQTWAELARGVAEEFGLILSDDEVDYALWEHTGYPSFWQGDPAECCKAQLREHFGSVTAAQ